MQSLVKGFGLFGVAKLHMLVGNSRHAMLQAGSGLGLGLG